MNPPAAYQTIIFTHIPKVAGMTVRQIVQFQYPPEQVFTIFAYTDESLQTFVGLSEIQKQRLRAVQGHIGFGVHDYLGQPATYFTLLRDPVERAISYYYFIRRHHQHSKHKLLVEGNIGLREYVEREISAVGTDNEQTRFLGGGLNCGEDIPYGQVTRQVLENAKTNLKRHYSVVGLTEKFGKTLLLLQRTYGWRIPLSHNQNVGTNRPSLHEIDSETLALLRQCNQLDYELYAFAQDLFEQQVAARVPNINLALFQYQLKNRARTWKRSLNGWRVR